MRILLPLDPPSTGIKAATLPRRQPSVQRSRDACNHGAGRHHQGPGPPAGGWCGGPARWHACVAGAPSRSSLHPRAPPTPPSSPLRRPQIEFYFSDSNLPRDKFLTEQVAADADGYVDIALLCIFQRVAALLKSSVRDAAAVKQETVADVADALEGSDALALDDARKRVRRTAALTKNPDEVRGGHMRQPCVWDLAAPRPGRCPQRSRQLPTPSVVAHRRRCTALPPTLSPRPTAPALRLPTPPGDARGGRAQPVRLPFPLRRQPGRAVCFL